MPQFIRFRETINNIYKPASDMFANLSENPYNILNVLIVLTVLKIIYINFDFILFTPVIDYLYLQVQYRATETLAFKFIMGEMSK